MLIVSFVARFASIWIPSVIEGGVSRYTPYLPGGCQDLGQGMECVLERVGVVSAVCQPVCVHLKSIPAPYGQLQIDYGYALELNTCTC